MRTKLCMGASRSAPATSAMRLPKSAARNCGLLVSGATRVSATISAAVFNPRDHGAVALAARAYSNAAFAYGRAMVARSATSNLRGQFIQQFGVGLRIDFAPEQAGSAFDRELADFLAELFARPRALTRHFIMALRHQPLRFSGGGALGFLDNFVRALARHIHDLRRAIARFTKDFLGACLGFGQIFFALAGSGKPRGYLARALVHRAQNHRPHDLHREHDEGDEHEHLHDQREIDVHSRLLTSELAGRSFNASARR